MNVSRIFRAGARSFITRSHSIVATRNASALTLGLSRMGVSPTSGFGMVLPTMQTRGMANHRHKKIIKLAKGYRGRGKNCYSIAYRRVQKARQYAYRDRKVKKREFRKLWIMRINAASRIYGMNYAQLINGLARANIIMDRRMLAELAVNEPLSFKSTLEVARLALLRAPEPQEQAQQTTE